MTVAELRRTMPAEELNGWMRLERIRQGERDEAERKMKHKGR